MTHHRGPANLDLVVHTSDFTSDSDIRASLEVGTAPVWKLHGIPTVGRTAGSPPPDQGLSRRVPQVYRRSTMLKAVHRYADPLTRRHPRNS